MGAIRKEANVPLMSCCMNSPLLRKIGDTCIPVLQRYDTLLQIFLCQNLWKLCSWFGARSVLSLAGSLIFPLMHYRADSIIN
jgi:hypothetical protein